MSTEDNATIFSALATLPHEHFKLTSYEDAMTMSQHVRADLESKVARQLRDEVIGTIAHGAGMSSRTFVDFIQFLSEDPELQARFTGWRAKRRLTE
jgi:hypothetical protein